MKIRVHGNIKDTKTDQPIIDAIIKLYLDNEELKKSESVKNGFYEIIAEIDDYRIEKEQKLRVTFEKEGCQSQEHLVPAEEGAYNLDIALEKVAPPPEKPFNWTPFIIAACAAVFVLLVGGVVAWLLLSGPKTPVILSFFVEPNSIDAGQSVTLSWKTKNVSSVEIKPDVGDVESSGDMKLNPSRTTEYTLIAKNEKGDIKTHSMTLVVKDIILPKITIAPSISNPSTSQKVTFTASAEDQGDISRLEIFINGKKAKECTDSTCAYVGGPYSAGIVKYWADAYDTAGNKGTTAREAYIAVGITTGIAGYDLKSEQDRVLPFDYDGDGDDDLFLYRPGRGAACVVRSNKDGTFTGVYMVPDNGPAPPNGIAGFDLLNLVNQPFTLAIKDQVLPFDYDGDGDDDLFLYRPGRGAACVARSNGDGTFTGVYMVPDNGSAPPNGIAGFDLLDKTDQALAFDYDGDGDDDLFLYRQRPMAGSAGKACVARSNGDGKFEAVYMSGSIKSSLRGNLILTNVFNTGGNYQVHVFDCDGDRNDDLVIYERRKDIIVARSNGDGTFKVRRDILQEIERSEDTLTWARESGVRQSSSFIEVRQLSLFDFNGDTCDDLFIYGSLKPEAAFEASFSRYVELGAVWLAQSRCDGTFETLLSSKQRVRSSSFSKTREIYWEGWFDGSDGIIPFDCDGDRDDDLVTFKNYIRVGRSNGDGTFKLTSNLAQIIKWSHANYKSPQVFAFDYNGDRIDDLFFYHPGSGFVCVVRSMGDGNFKEAYIRRGI